jgi:hypothetical protein
LARAALVTLGTGAASLAPGCALPQDRSEGPLDAGFAEGGSAEDGDGSLVGVGTFYGSISGLMGSGGSSSGPIPSSGSSSGVPECTAVKDCMMISNEPICCVQEQCLIGTSATEVACADPLVQMIQASNYDQSCSVDTDCVAVAEGNFCVPGANNCLTAAVNKSAKSQYLSDVANTNAAFCTAPVSCPSLVTCGTSTGPWCVNGTCEMNACPPNDAGADAPTAFGVDADVDGGD